MNPLTTLAAAAMTLTTLLTGCPPNSTPPPEPAPLTELRQAWLDQGATRTEAQRIVDVAVGNTDRCRGHGESGGNPNARRPARGTIRFWGLTQISRIHLPGLREAGIIGNDPNALFDPYTNGRAAWWVYHQAYGDHGQGWAAWDCRDTTWPRRGRTA